MAEPFATHAELEARWPSFPYEQQDYADQLLIDASNMIRERWPDADDRIAAGTLMAESLERIVCQMVKTAMMNPDTEGLESQGITTGPFSVSRNFSNPTGSLYFTAEMIRLLDGYNRATARMGWLC